ncbi:MAG: c-type cytochrome [Pirellulaceae bacterium]|nr:c-type cytochrome [Pirellulaceae bacterium]
MSIGQLGWATLLIASFTYSAIAQDATTDKKPAVEQVVAAVAGNEQVAEILRTRPGRGVMADDSQPTPPEQSLKTFKLKSGLTIELVASEPAISQPLFLSWDSAGRMWVVQYRQYQYPAGLKVVRFDQHLRAVFDRVPEPPPNHVLGADVISVLEDTDGDQRYDRQRDVITGLNICTSVAIGYGGIWVLNPPYLLFYPDRDNDAVPDADPEVHLSGFGLQDTHSVANSLLIGPDGWLYGANGSTTAGSIVSAATKATTFEGQCLWRYHPTSRVFEIYAEGGGNTFSLDIDAQGHVFSGTNGGETRGWHYPQGSYGQKNWGKHGPLTNPFAFGYFSPMKSEGDKRRFPQAFLIYDGGWLGEDFNGSVIAPNSMHNLVWHSRRYADGSTFRTVDEPNMLECSDRWFRPVYAGVGPDGAVYLADWYDTRLSHVSPIDDWHKTSGRIYRIRPDSSAVQDALATAGTTADKIGTAEAADQHAVRRLAPGQLVSLQGMSAEQLVTMLRHPNKWVRQRAALELGWQQQSQIAAQLIRLVEDESSLDAVWALNNLGELTLQRATAWLQHSDPHIRRWVVRLLGDRHEGPIQMAELAARETDVQVRSQLAASARRIPANVALPVIHNLLAHHQDISDPHMPLMIWWAIQQHAEEYDAILRLLGDRKVWTSPIMRQIVAERLMQRYATSDGPAGLQRCAQLLQIAPDQSARDALVNGLNNAFQGRRLPPELPPVIQDALNDYRQARGVDGIVLAAQQGDAAALHQAHGWLQDNQADIGLRIEAARLFGSQNYPPAVEDLLNLAAGRTTQQPALQRAALQALAQYDQPRIGPVILAAFDSTLPAEHGLRETACRTLASRPAWALALLNEINQWRIRKQDIPSDVISQLRNHSDRKIVAAVDEAFGAAPQANSPERVERIRLLSQLLQPLLHSVGADAAVPASASLEQLYEGKRLFMDRCGKCHQLFGQGEKIGPALDTYDRSNLNFWSTAIVAPSVEIREGYQTYALLTSDGRVVTGLLVASDLQSTTLRTAEQHLVTVAKAEVEQLQAIPQSLMPDDLLNDLTDPQLLALFRYLIHGYAFSD